MCDILWPIKRTQEKGYEINRLIVMPITFFFRKNIAQKVTVIFLNFVKSNQWSNV